MVKTDKTLLDGIYSFFIKKGIDSTQRGSRICGYLGIDVESESGYELSQMFFKKFSSGNDKILIINPGYDMMSNDYYTNLFALTKECKRDIKLKLILD